MTTTTREWEELDLDGDVTRLDEVESDRTGAGEPITCCQGYPPET